MAASISMRESIDLYLKTKAGKSATYRRDLGVTFGILQRRMGDMQMRHLRDEHFCAAFDRWLTELSPSTFNKRLGHVQDWLTFASRRRQLRVSPAELLGSVEKRRVVPRKRVRLSVEELLGLLDACAHPRDRAYLAIAMNTGLRVSEIISLRISDLDLANGTLYVLRHKTGLRDALPVTVDLDAEMREWLSEYTRRVGVLKDDYYLVPAKSVPALRRGGGKLTRAEKAAAALKPSVQMYPNNGLMRQLLAAAGHEVEREGMHTIRRSVARAAYEYWSGTEHRDEALCMVQALLGHATQGITEKYIGVERFVEKRDKAMRGQSYLSAMRPDRSNVSRLKA